MAKFIGMLALAIVLTFVQVLVYSYANTDDCIVCQPMVEEITSFDTNGVSYYKDK